MNENLKIKVGLDSLQKAKAYKSSRNCGRSFAHYLVYLELMPARRQDVELEFAEVLYNWGVTLEASDQVEDLCKCYLQALTYFPLNIEILNNFGVHLIRVNQNREAEKYLRLANNLDKEFLPAEKNLCTARMNLVPRWHFRMLNDADRNDNYRRAISSYRENADCKALDVGAGSGILSLFAAANANIGSIYAVEMSQTMAKISKDSFVANGITKVTSINKASSELTANDIDGPADLLIMELFDSALFGEHVLSTTLHAWENLLKKGAKTIPAGASLYVTGINCEKLAKNHRLRRNVPKLNLHDACLTQSIKEPYEAEKLKDFSYTKVTATEKVVSVNFADVHQLNGIYRDKNFIDSVVLDCVESGSVDALVFWFDLNLDDERTITTNPDDENVKCWEQAVVYLDHPVAMNVGDRFEVIVSFVNSKLEAGIAAHESRRCSECFKSSPGIISFLNDEDLVSSLELASDSINASRVLDLYPFPLLGLISAKKGATCYCSLSSEEDETFVRYVCRVNDIDSERVVNLKDDVRRMLVDENTLDVILVNPVSNNGTIDERCLQDLELYLHCLKPGGKLLPNSVDLHVQIVDSEYLNYFNKVDDRNLFGYKVAKFVNEYAISEQWIMDGRFPHVKLSEPTAISNVLLNDGDALRLEREVSIVEHGTANGIFYWFELVFTEGIKLSSCASTYYNCACFLIDEPISVRKGTSVVVGLKQHCGLLKMTCAAKK